ncbi:MAG: GDSL-type esterase/lipase family protein [Flavobacteriales bacterium]
MATGCHTIILINVQLRILNLVCWLLLVFSIKAQKTDKGVLSDSLNLYCFPDFNRIDSNLTKQYPFIAIEKNNFQFFTSKSPNWEHLYREFSNMLTKKDRDLHFYHIGGSHLQADIYTHDFRTFLQSNWEGISGERGIIFPFNLAKTNNPTNYIFSSPNVWTAYRSVNHRPETIDYGLMGVAIVCRDSVINMTFKYNQTIVKPPFQAVRIYHNKGELPFELNFGTDEILVYRITQNMELGYTDVYFTDALNELDLQFYRTSNEILEFELYGIQFMNGKPGISYTTIGVNGAGLYTYLDNVNFEEQLKLYPPDFFAFSVGTNDGNVPYDRFDPQIYKRNLELMMQRVLRANPKCAILLTVPNDSYYKRKYLNRNIAREREVIIELAEQYKMPVWDFYGIMGELGSSSLWQRKGLMQSDLVHFTSMGYHLKGNLLIDAFLKYMDQMRMINELKNAN